MKTVRSVCLAMLSTACLNSVSAQQFPEYAGELYVTVDASSDIKVEAVSTIWGKYSDGFPVIDSLSGGSISGALGLSFDNCDDWDCNPKAIAYSLYRVTVTHSGNSHSIYIDWRDCDYPTRTNYTGGDIEPYYCTSGNTWEVNNNSVSEGDTVCVWDATAGLKSIHHQNTGGFEPTCPSNPSISNSGGHPYLSWTASEPASAKYHVYRSTNGGTGWTQMTTSPLTSTSWLDEEVYLGGAAKKYYKVRALSGDGTKWSAGYSNIDSCTGHYQEGRVAAEGVSPKVVPHAIKCASYPNPFNPSTTITFDIPVDANLTIAIYDVLGREVAAVAKGYYEAGHHTTVWNAISNASGVYLVRMVASDASGVAKYSSVNKLLLMK